MSLFARKNVKMTLSFVVTVILTACGEKTQTEPQSKTVKATNASTDLNLSQEMSEPAKPQVVEEKPIEPQSETEAPTSNPARIPKTDVRIAKTDPAQEKIVNKIKAIGGSVSKNFNGQIRSVSADGKRFGDEDMKLIASIPSLEQIGLFQCDISDNGLRHLKELSHLSFVHIHDANITGAGLREWKSLSKIMEFSFYRTALDDNGLQSLKDCQALEKLDIERATFTGAGFENWKVQNLKTLFLVYVPITDQGAKAIGRLTSVEKLRFWGEEITDKGVESLSGLTNLKEFECGSKQITGAGFARWKYLEKLKVLDVSHTGLTNDGLKGLGDLTQLEDLDLRQTQITDDGLIQISGLKNLKFLTLGKNVVDPKNWTAQ